MANAHSRPIAPHLSVWRWHATMLSSILHRATGIGNYLGAVALVIWLVLLATNSEPLVGFLFEGPMEWVTRIGLIALTWSASYHWFNGLRHLAWDAGTGFDPQGSNLRSLIIIVLSVIATAAIWFAALTGGAS
ncbi:succinate dehydrogenase, cytochrome b556 subunit [Hyphobacterium marinum]|uniref:Succinate dehydrogenase cytochrome b556 subunit n=1 Tax=Hyphobacterium marinum TaxID=3116574 RepID=A0ABU7LWJ9_9PROT|nr:succinate dehydrogenase, cytochrome b556 subunit [Hyphobacterium sp. Y6023]MEE2565570.1 succinate dehydrogenase, cytochrome b556 subunit [Hyphobacterium sp. Y6023]